MKLPKTPPDHYVIWQESKEDDEQAFYKIVQGLGLVDEKQRYLHWEELRFRTPPEGLTVKQWWAGTKFSRMSSYVEVPLYDKQHKKFKFCLPPIIQEQLHEMDMQTGGTLSTGDSLLNPSTKSTYLIRSLVDEAINSSQLEGAATTRNVAKEMIRQGRSPSNESEQMIYNNYQVMRMIADLKGEKLSVGMIKNIHNALVDETLPEYQAGVFRSDEDQVQVIDSEGNVLHDPPPASELLERMQKLCDFANCESTTEFIHPVIRAIVLHFMIGYDHPFVDGNGRTARALFYWAMSAEDYWLMEFISLSGMIKKAPIQYGMAYLYTETDDNDLTYFIFNQMHVVKEALIELEFYLERKRAEIELAQSLFSSNQKLNRKLNFRQLNLVRHALAHPNFHYKIKEHQNSHGITYDTARKDLVDLSDKHKILVKKKQGKSFSFISPSNLSEKLSK